jgi:hypothetical protein
MLDDTFRGIQRDVFYAIRDVSDLGQIDSLVHEAVQMTQRPDEITRAEWNGFVHDLPVAVNLALLEVGHDKRAEAVSLAMNRCLLPFVAKY